MLCCSVSLFMMLLTMLCCCWPCYAVVSHVMLMLAMLCCCWPCYAVVNHVMLLLAILCCCWPCYAVVRKVQFLTTHRVGWSMLTSKFSLCTSFDGTSRADATQLFQSLIDIFQEVVQYNKVSHASRHKYYDIFKFHLFIYFRPLEHVHCTLYSIAWRSRFSAPGN